MQNTNCARQLARTQIQKAIWNTEYICSRASERSEFLVVRTCSKRNAYTHTNAGLQSPVGHLRPQFFAAPQGTLAIVDIMPILIAIDQARSLVQTFRDS